MSNFPAIPLATATSAAEVELRTQLAVLAAGLPTTLAGLPPKPATDRDPSVPHAPARNPKLTPAEKQLALKNALRYFATELHETLAPEFLNELNVYGHIYMYRLRPTSYTMKAHPIHLYPAKCTQAAAIMVMIQNNLDIEVAQFPHELITYGGNGSVFSNWAQYLLAMHYLSQMTEEQTLAMYSGHPAGLFPSHREGPRVVVTNGMVVPNYSSPADYERMYATGVSQYGQMTAGSYCYIGPQGIVHGTTLTLLNAGRKYLGSSELQGKVFVTSGLGGMSGAQPKAGVICKAIAVVAEINGDALRKRHRQGWLNEYHSDLTALVARIKQARAAREVVSIGYLGNVVDLWEHFAKEPELLVELGSDQTSLHNPFMGGYYPAGLTYEESNTMMREKPEAFREAVNDSLRRQVDAINRLVARGMRFWDYGNSFMLQAGRAGANILRPDGGFLYPSYVEDIMGDIFSLGFGPFRWVCTSGKREDLLLTDQLAAEVIREAMKEASDRSRMQYDDNLLWITSVDEHQLVVGSQARILYSDATGRARIAAAMNTALREGRLSGPVVLSRDHHDVSGTDSPWRETSHIRDGSMFCADMAIQNVIGDSFRGATWVSIHNGGGTGWGEAMNGGFGMVLDGSSDAERRARHMLHWDVNNGIARRAWAGVDNAEFQIRAAMKEEPLLTVTMPHHADQALLTRILSA
ncbi:urocanate hydratase [Capsaspora owczarzaki ATCC 30864]|nr:urocanate hydratase [Capsaspora owczarzaki ATCC 30864]|eukprot:XP_004365980.1 urocanate hydratase [Capsaspora owczarzaki ATCC 30864]